MSTTIEIERVLKVLIFRLVTLRNNSLVNSKNRPVISLPKVFCLIDYSEKCVKTKT